MSVAEKIVDNDLEVSAEARQRINSARSFDISFVVKKRLGDKYTSDDVEMIVEMIVLTLEKKHSLSKEYVVDFLKSRGRSAHKAEQLAAALLK